MLPESQRRGSCKPCRESKAQCDKKKPRCTECVTNNKPCGGYDMGHIFINVNSTGPPPVWNRSQNAQKYLVLDMASQPPPVCSGPQFPDISGTALPKTSVQPSAALFCSVEASSSMTALAPLTLSTYPTPDADPNNIPGIVELFLDLYYKRFGSDRSSTDLLTAGNECGGWRLLLPFWLGQSPILDTAIGALATCFVGTQYQDPSLIDQGQDAYLSALQMVQQALSEPGSTDRKDLLATTLVMSSIELFLSNGGGASQVTHIDGANRLLNAAFRSLDFEELHLYILHQGLFEAISNRRRYAFSSPSYRSIIHQLYSLPRANQNHLYFQLCELILPLPNILSAADSVTTSAASSRSSTPTPSSAVLSILDDLTALEQSMTPWHEHLKSNTPSPWTFPAAQISTDSVPFPLQFDCIELCAVYCLYWACQCLVLEARHRLYADLPLSEIHEHPAPATLLPQMIEYASLVCRSVQFCTQNTSFAATENMLFPLFIVAGYYKRQGDEDRMRWCVGAFTRISREQNIGYTLEQFDHHDARAHPLTPAVDHPHVWDEAF